MRRPRSLPAPGLLHQLAHLRHPHHHRAQGKELAVHDSWARTRAKVVLPLPGGPQKIIEEKRRLAFMARQRMRPSPTRCPWPTNSLSSRGRSRAANGSGGAKSEGVLGFMID